MNNNDKYIDDIITSIDNIERAQARPDLFNEIIGKLPQTKIIPLKKLYWIAAASIILISLNIFSVSSQSKQTQLEPSDDTYKGLLTDYSLYN